MTLRIAAAAALILGGTAAEPHEPGYFAAPDFPLTVRDAPGGAPVGELPAGAAPIEIGVMDDADAWGRVPFGERDGWVAMDALRPYDPQPTPYAAIPAGLICAGTEPFWSIVFGADGASFSEPGEEPVSMGVETAAPAEGRIWPLAIRLSAATAILRPAACHDGMSDRTLVWSVDLLDDDGLLSGCCRLPLPD